MGVDPATVGYVQGELRAMEDRVARAFARGIKQGQARVPSVQAPYGTVVGVTGSSAQVQLDVDGQVISTTLPAHVSVAVGDRVSVLVLPPAGSLVLGKVG